MKKFIANVTVLTLSFLPFTVMAQVPKALDTIELDTATQAGKLGYGAAPADIKDTILEVVNWILGFLGIAAIVLVIYGGILWMTSGGADARAKKGQMVIKNAVIGLAIILFAYIIVNFVIKALLDVTG